MGNKSGVTQFKGGSLLIELDNQHYVAGQRITGTVSYLLDDTFPAEKITLELTGKERHLWEGHDENHMNKKHPGKICIKSTLLKMSVVLHKFPSGEAQPGCQKFPFAF